MARPLQLLLLALSVLAPPAWAVELSGTIHSATGTLPADIKIVAERGDKLPAIAGAIDNGRYRIDLPDTGLFRVRVQANGWDAGPKVIHNPAKGSRVSFLVYPVPVPDPQLAEELTRMGEQDQAIRKQIPEKFDPEFWKRMAGEDKLRQERLARIIEEKGWPLASQVGHQAANSAWLIAQHGSDDFLKRCLPLMQAAADRHELPLSSLALSIDRVLMHDGQKQRYGSQFQTDKDGRTVVYPIDEMATLDERRASMGLEPFAQYRKNFE